MIESILALLALIGFAEGDGDIPKSVQLDNNNHEMIRAIESQELKGFENLEVHNAEEWFV